MQRNNTGFTLIEVLIALAILSIALTAIIHATTQNIKHTVYLQNRTIATWVGTNVINEARAGMLKLPEAPDHVSEETTVLGVTWTWQAVINTTPNKNIQQIDVTVYQKTNEAKLAHLVSYLYAPQ